MDRIARSGRRLPASVAGLRARTQLVLAAFRTPGRAEALPGAAHFRLDVGAHPAGRTIGAEIDRVDAAIRPGPTPDLDNPVEEGLDLAVRIRELPDSELKA